MGVTVMKTPAEQALAGQFAEVAGSLPGAAESRREAMARFEATGLPHRRIEAWHYTDLRALMRRAEPPAPAGTVAEAWQPAEGLATMTFVNGWLAPGLPALPGVAVEGLAARLGAGRSAGIGRSGAFELSGEAAVQLNTAFMSDGAVIAVSPGTAVTTPLHLAFETALEKPAAAFARVLVEVGAGASLTLVETHRGPAGIGYQTNVLVEIVLGEGASIEHVRFDAAGDRAQAISTLSASVAAHAVFRSLSLVEGAALSRHQVFARLHGDDARLSVGGVTLVNRDRHADTTLLVEHSALRGESRETFKTVADGEGTGVFQGKIVVKAEAQKTDGRMSSNALLLGETARMLAKPELEIFADDVQCAHGATAGALDHDLLFYLMSRGLPRAEAEALMIQAFCGEAIEQVEHEGLRSALNGRVEAWVKARV
jgi:Fe-S cluster assembly protein SufD